MLGAAGLDLQDHLDLVHVQPRGQPVVPDLEHVRAEVGQVGEELGQRSGMVGQQAAEGQVPAGRGEAVAEQLDQQQRVDVAAGQQHHHRRDEVARVLQQRRHPGRPGRLDHLLGPLQAQQQTAGQALLRDRHHPPAVAGHDAERDVTRAADRDAVRHGPAGLHRHRVPGGQRARIGRDRLRLHADHGDLGVQGLDRHRDAGRQPAAAHRHHHGAHLRALLDDLEAERALAGHDVRVVVGVDEHGAGPLGEGQRLAERILHAGAVQDDLRAVPAGGLHLGQRRARGHDHGGRAAELPGGERDALGVVARAGRDDAAGPFGVGEPGDPVVRSADLEQPGPLQVLALEVHRPAHHLGQHPGVQHGRVRDHIVDQLAGRGHVVGANGA